MFAGSRLLLPVLRTLLHYDSILFSIITKRDVLDIKALCFERQTPANLKFGIVSYKHEINHYNNLNLMTDLSCFKTSN